MPKFIAEPDEKGLRLDAWLARRLPELSRGRIQSLISQNCVTIKARTVKPGMKVTLGLTAYVDIPPPVAVAPTPENIPLKIMHEDADIVVVDKAPGLVVHPAAGHASGTLVNALLHHCPDLQGINGELRPGIAHRLDRDTSGLLVAAKNDEALKSLQTQFKEHKVRKIYIALVAGHPTPPEGTIRSLIGRSPRDRKKMTATPTRGREAITHYETIRNYGNKLCSLLRVRIETGRTHQIRVHLSHLGHYVIGDPVYSRGPAIRLPVKAGRQMLHAAELSFKHPRTNEQLVFTSPIPADMKAVLEAL